MNPDRVHPEAWFEFIEAARYYNEHQAGLGAEFVEEIKEAVRVIDQDPECGSSTDVDGARSLRVRRFPYVVIFDSFTSPPTIAAVYHERRRPGGWTKRLS